MHAKYITLKRLIALFQQGDATDLVSFYADMPAPNDIRIGLKRYKVPQTLEELVSKITWEQRLFLAVQPANDIDLILRMFDCWFYTEVTGELFDEAKALKFGKKALNCFIDELIPATTHIARLTTQLFEFEQSKTYSAPNSDWQAAGGSRLDKYANLYTNDYLATKLRCAPDEVKKRWYADCLVWLAERRDSTDVTQKYQELMSKKAMKNV